MADEKRKETDEELMERFDTFVRSTLLEEVLFGKLDGAFNVTLNATILC